MKKSWNMPAVFAFAATLMLSFVSCTYEGDNTVVSLTGAEEESTGFISEALALIAPEEKEIDSMTVRFYEGDSYIPYVPLQYFFEQYMKYMVVQASYANDEYRYTVKDTANGNKRYYVVVNKKKDTITIPAFMGLQDTDGDENSDSAFFFKKMCSMISKIAGENNRTFDLAKYGFKAYGSYDDVFLPLCIVSNLFSSLLYERYFYNGKAVYQTTSKNDTYYDESKGYTSFYDSDWFVDSSGNLKERPQALIDYSYNLLRFTHDYLYGHSGYYGFADDGNGYPDEAIVAAADKLDFDQMMRAYANDARSLLLSSSYTDYATGLTALFMNVYGDCHTGIRQNFIATNSEYDQNFYYSKKFLESYFLRTDLPALRENARGTKTPGASYTPYTTTNASKAPVPSFEVIDNNKTAIIRFDQFTADYDAWSAYYAGSPQANPDPATVSLPDDAKSNRFVQMFNQSNFGNLYMNFPAEFFTVPRS